MERRSTEPKLLSRAYYHPNLYWRWDGGRVRCCRWVEPIHECAAGASCPARKDRDAECVAEMRSRVLLRAYVLRQFLAYADEEGETAQHVRVREASGGTTGLTRQVLEKSLEIVRPLTTLAELWRPFEAHQAAFDRLTDAMPLSAFPWDNRHDPEDAPREHRSALGLTAMRVHWDEEGLPLLSDRFRKEAGSHLRAFLRPRRVRKVKRQGEWEDVPTRLAVAEDLFTRACLVWSEHSPTPDVSEEELLDATLAGATPRQREHVEAVLRHLRDPDEPSPAEAKRRAALDLGISVKAIDMTFSRLRHSA